MFYGSASAKLDTYHSKETVLLQLGLCLWLGKKKYMCVFQVSRPYLGFCPDPKNFIVNCEQNVVKFAGKMGENVLKNAISI